MQRPYTATVSAGNRLVGLGVVIVLHIGIIAALLAGLARTAVDIVKAPIETEIIEELRPEPPDNPPPPPPPQLNTPPPPFIPPPEIQVAQPPPPQTQAIAAVTTTKPPDTPPTQFRQPTRTAPVVDAKRSCRTPEYPAQSQRLEEQGTVVLAFLIDVDGRVIDSRVESTSGSNRLDEAARKALSLCRFKPGTADGKPEQAWASIRYVWRLSDAR